MSDAPAVHAIRCPRCGAALRDAEKPCWLCHAPSNASATSPYQPPSIIISEAVADRYTTFDYVSMAILSLCAILAVLIGIGITLDDQGMLVPFLIVVSPAFLVTLGKGLHSWSQTGRPQPGKMLLTLLTAGVVTISVIALLIVAGIVMLFAICLSQIAPR